MIHNSGEFNEGEGAAREAQHSPLAISARAVHMRGIDTSRIRKALRPLESQELFPLTGACIVQPDKRLHRSFCCVHEMGNFGVGAPPQQQQQQQPQQPQQPQQQQQQQQQQRPYGGPPGVQQFGAVSFLDASSKGGAVDPSADGAGGGDGGGGYSAPLLGGTGVGGGSLLGGSDFSDLGGVSDFGGSLLGGGAGFTWASTTT